MDRIVICRLCSRAIRVRCSSRSGAAASGSIVSVGCAASCFGAGCGESSSASGAAFSRFAGRSRQYSNCIAWPADGRAEESVPVRHRRQRNRAWSPAHHGPAMNVSTLERKKPNPPFAIGKDEPPGLAGLSAASAGFVLLVTSKRSVTSSMDSTGSAIAGACRFSVSLTCSMSSPRSCCNGQYRSAGRHLPSASWAGNR